MAKEQDFEIFSGNDAVLEISVVDEDNNDAPLDLSAYTAIEWALALKASSSAKKIEKDLSDGISIVSAVGGTLTVEIDAADTEPLKNEYYHEMRVTDSSGKKVTVLFGAVTIKENLIRD